VLALGFAAFLLAAAGRPLHYWGARPAVVTAEVQPGTGLEAQVEEVGLALDKGALVFRLTFDRPVRDALFLKDGTTPVSGRLHAAVYLDADDDRTTGLAQGSLDARTGADYQLDIGVLALGADADEKRPAQALVTATLFSLQGNRRRTVWRGDDTDPLSVSAYNEWLDVRLPAGAVPAKAGTRVILASGARSWDGRYKP
jgi:hypothetical protein